MLEVPRATGFSDEVKGSVGLEIFFLEEHTLSETEHFKSDWFLEKTACPKTLRSIT